MRTLPISLTPGADESFASYVDRLAASLGVPLHALLARTGLIASEHFSEVPKGYGVGLSPTALQAFSRAVRLTEERVSRMLVASYHGAVYDFTSLDPTDTSSCSSAARSWVYFSGSHLCPSCLLETGGVWRLEWKLPWSFICTRHGTLLADTCPSCSRMLAYGRPDGRTAPAFLSRVPTPMTCQNVLPRENTVPGRASKPCGYPLDLIEAAGVAAWPRLLEAQGRLATAIAGRAQVVGGEKVSSLDYFSDLQSVCAMILALGEVDDVGELPSEAERTFASHIGHRQEVRRLRAERAEIGEDTRKGPHLRPYSTTPQSAALLTALVPTAMSILDASSARGLSESLEPFLRRGSTPESDYPQSRLMNNFGMSSRLLEAARGCARPRPVRFLPMYRTRGVEDQQQEAFADLSCAHVPQLFWKEEFENGFQDLLRADLVQTRTDFARRYCSLAIAKLIEGLSWKTTAEALGLAPLASASAAMKMGATLKRCGNREVFISRLTEVAEKLATAPYRIDYGKRRREFADLRHIESWAWSEICCAAGIREGRGARRRFATVWLWCYITGGDYRLAPGLCELEHWGWDAYRQFLGQDLTKLREPLESHALELLGRTEDGTIFAKLGDYRNNSL